MKKIPNIVGSLLVVVSLLLILIVSMLIDFQEPYFVMEYYYNINDRSINQNVNESLQSSIDSYNEISNEDLTYSTVKVPTDRNGMLSSYDTYFDIGTKVIFLSGFLFEESLIEYSAQKNSNFIIFVDDGEKTFTKENEDNPYISSISAEEIYSGFIAGFLGSLYLVAEYPDDSSEWVLGTWGGFPFPSVQAFMTGFLDGIEFFKQIILENFDSSSYIYQNIAKMKLVAPFGDEGDDPGKRWYTNSWEADGTGTSAAFNLIKQGANVIYPVAGDQTKELIDYIKEQDNDARVIGIDADATILYPGSEDIVLFSTIKDFSTGISEDIEAFYRYETDEEISTAIEANEVYQTQIEFNHGESNYFDKILFEFANIYNLNDMFESAFGAQYSIEDLIELVKQTETYKNLDNNNLNVIFGE